MGTNSNLTQRQPRRVSGGARPAARRIGGWDSQERIQLDADGTDGVGRNSEWAVVLLQVRVLLLVFGKLRWKRRGG